MRRWPIVHWEAVKAGILGSQASGPERRVPQCVVLVSYLDHEGGEMTYVGHSWSGAADSRSQPHLVSLPVSVTLNLGHVQFH